MEEVFIDNDVTLITGGTDNHLLLIDTMNSYGIPGSEAERALDEIGITVNKNVLPDDMRKPLDPSGIRLGTPALTTRGMQEGESKEVANLIIAALRSHNDHDALKLLRGKVETLCQAFPVPDTFRP
jgi:glycine hydroxymethyltransferase